MDFLEIKQIDEEKIAHTYKRFNACITKGKNATCYDANGKEYIDFTSGIGVNSLGFSDDDWSDAVSNQSKMMQHSSNLFYNENQVKLADKITALTGAKKIFYSNSGAEANEGAIKVARKYSFDKYGNGRNEIIALKNSFHGRTITTLSATGQDVFHNFFFPFTEGFKFAMANDFDSVIAEYSEKTCGIMIELVQGEGGVMPLEKDFVKKIEEFCKEKDLVLIVDEVQTGFGRTGKILACQNYGINPDIVTLAKGLGGGLPIGAVLLYSKTESVLGYSDHGTTYGGNPIACAGALVVSEKVPGILDEITEKGEYIKNELIKMEGVKEVRGLGMMIGIVLDGERKAADVLAKCLENGLMVLTAKTLVRFLPPLTITKEEIDKGLKIFKECVK